MAPQQVERGGVPRTRKRGHAGLEPRGSGTGQTLQRDARDCGLCRCADEGINRLCRVDHPATARRSASQPARGYSGHGWERIGSGSPQAVQ